MEKANKEHPRLRQLQCNDNTLIPCPPWLRMQPRTVSCRRLRGSAYLDAESVYIFLEMKGRARLIAALFKWKFVSAQCEAIIYAMKCAEGIFSKNDGRENKKKTASFLYSTAFDRTRVELFPFSKLLCRRISRNLPVITLDKRVFGFQGKPTSFLRE